jgi:hypothetical protein
MTPSTGADGSSSAPTRLPEHRLRVLVAGSSAHTNGGIPAVQRLLEKFVPDDVELLVHPTFTEGGAATRLHRSLVGVAGAVLRLLTQPVDLRAVTLDRF